MGSLQRTIDLRDRSKQREQPAAQVAVAQLLLEISVLVKVAGD
ncbi:hypothetical protein [Actinomadura sp. HBU206391]|nr:hypothetical protein [Actinomadura sp. HBU206391]